MLAERLKQYEVWIRQRAGYDQHDYRKPIVRGTRKNRNCKPQIYKLAAQLAKKNNVHGHMVSLGAAYALEIMKEFKSSIWSNCFFNIEGDQQSFNSLYRYYSSLRINPYIDTKDLNYLNRIRVINDDIFQFLRWKEDSVFEGRDPRLGIIDLDLMKRLDHDLVDKIYRSLERPGTLRDKFLLAIWSTYGRSCSEDDYDYNYRPYLIHKFILDKEARYKLIDYELYKYTDNHIPLKVELLVLENK